MRHAALLAIAGLLCACQGPSLAAATARPATLATKEAPRPDAGFRSFLTDGGESPTGSSLDLDRAMDTILDAQARARSRTPANPTNECLQQDEIDRFACERGISREQARRLYKNRGYTQPAPDAK